MADLDTVGIMDSSAHRIAFGPIPSRRLGRSLGVNNIPAKVCSYACRYCQVGTTTEQSIEPRAFFDPAQIRDAVTAHLGRIRTAGRMLTISASSPMASRPSTAASVRASTPCGSSASPSP